MTLETIILGHQQVSWIDSIGDNFNDGGIRVQFLMCSQNVCTDMHIRSVYMLKYLNIIHDFFAKIIV